MSSRRIAVAAVSVAALVTMAGCSGDSSGPKYTPVAAPAAALSVGKAGVTVKIGVVYTQEPGFAGSDVNQLAEGAVVAAERLNLGGGSHVELIRQSDLGTAAGAQQAVDALQNAGVAGIVYASVGAQVQAGLTEAAKDGLPVLLPYEDGSDLTGPLAAGQYLTTGSVSEIATAMTQDIAANKYTNTLILSTAALPAGAGSLGQTHVVSNTTPAALQSQLRPLLQLDATTGASAISDVVIWAGPKDAADIVAAIQNVAGDVPVLLSPQALDPAFSNELSSLSAGQNGSVQGGATTEGDFTTFGPETADFGGSLHPTQAGFTSALRIIAMNTGVKGLNSQGADFAEAGAAWADGRSHDAVLALAAAIAKAGSSDPKAVTAALSGLTVTASQANLVGPDLTFTSSQALPQAGVSVLRATTQGTGERVSVLPADRVPSSNELSNQSPADVEPAISWFLATN